MIVNVTKLHIKNGKKSCSNRCAVALAISDCLDGYNRVLVEHDLISINGQLFDTSLEVEMFIDALDVYQKVKPFSFDLDYKEESHEV